MCYYRPQTKFAKVMFLHLSVNHSVHGGGEWYPSIPCRWYPSNLCRFPGPHPRGSLRGLTRGGLQVHTQRGLQAHTRGVSRPTPGRVCIPACTEADPPLWLMATAAGGTHPTGMHSCHLYDFTLIFVITCIISLSAPKNCW